MPKKKYENTTKKKIVEKLSKLLYSVLGNNNGRSHAGNLLVAFIKSVCIQLSVSYKYTLTHIGENVSVTFFFLFRGIIFDFVFFNFMKYKNEGDV